MNRTRIAGDSIWQGFLIATGLNLLALVIGIVTIMAGIGMIIVGGFGVVQLFWLVPFYVKYKKQGKMNTAKGILLGAGLSFLLSATCWADFATRGGIH